MGPWSGFFFFLLLLISFYFMLHLLCRNEPLDYYWFCSAARVGSLEALWNSDNLGSARGIEFEVLGARYLVEATRRFHGLMQLVDRSTDVAFDKYYTRTCVVKYLQNHFKCTYQSGLKLSHPCGVDTCTIQIHEILKFQNNHSETSVLLPEQYSITKSPVSSKHFMIPLQRFEDEH